MEQHSFAVFGLAVWNAIPILYATCQTCGIVTQS